MNHNRNPVFTAENIIAILEAAPHGGATQEVLERAKVPISHSSLDKWIKDGRRDLRNEKQTAYRLFAEQWDTVYPGAPPRPAPQRGGPHGRGREENRRLRAPRGQGADRSEAP